MSEGRRMQINSHFSPKWIEDLSIKPGTLNSIEEKVGNSFEFVGIRKYFLNRIALAQTVRSTIKWDFPTDRWLISKIHNKVKKLDLKNQLTQLNLGYSAKQRIINNANSNG